jgi:DNA-directed RNA polymerase subunit RPC12/RpoP
LRECAPDSPEGCANSSVVRRFHYSLSKQVNPSLSRGPQDRGITGAFMIDEKVKIKCTKCSQVFRERAQNIRNGFQTNCQHCNRMITFDTGSEDRNIRRALTSAREIRMLLEARPKKESVAEAAVGDRSQF